MTTDITELAQSLKAAAENAIGAHERLAAYPYGEIIDLSQHEGEQINIDITDINEFHEEANPVNVLALVEALELKGEQRANWFQMAQKLGEDLDAAEKRIAEMESRTVTVKLPDIMPPEAAPAHYWVQGESMAYADGYNKSAADLKTSIAQSCSSAGVNVEFE